MAATLRAICSSVSSAVIGVLMNPGAIAFAVMPRAPSSFAVDSVSPMSPAFDEE